MKDLLLQSIGAGTIIGIAGLTFLSVSNPIIGALLFSFGLITILIQDYKLYTGRIGKLSKWDDIPTLLIILIGNFIGAFGLGLLLNLVGVCASAQAAAVAICAKKVSSSLFQSFLLACGCGAIMEIAVNNYKESQNIFIVALCVMVFILCGFEHCIANMFYFAFAHSFAFHYIGIQICGNTIGAILMNKIRKT